MTSDWDDNAALVLDNGSGVLKAGFAGEDQPRVAFAAAVATGRGGNAGTVLVGDEAQQAAGGYTIDYPIDCGIVQDWDGMEKLWSKMYRELAVDPSNQAVLVTEAPLNPKTNREHIATSLFETFRVPAVQLQIQAIMSLYSGGRTDGLVFDSGDGVSHIVPVFEGITMPTAIRRMDIAGRHLTEWLARLLEDETDRAFTTSADLELVRYVKEKATYVAPNFDAEMTLTETTEDRNETVALPDGSSITIARSRFGCPELLFDPSIFDRPDRGVQHLMMESIAACPIDIRRTLFSNVVLAGGSTMFRGIDTRIGNELAQLTKEAFGKANENIHVIAPGERKYSVWMGAAILGSLASFAEQWITKAEYDECGVNIIHQRTNALDFASK